MVRLQIRRTECFCLRRSPSWPASTAATPRMITRLRSVFALAREPPRETATRPLRVSGRRRRRLRGAQRIACHHDNAQQHEAAAHCDFAGRPRGEAKKKTKGKTSDEKCRVQSRRRARRVVRRGRKTRKHYCDNVFTIYTGPHGKRVKTPTERRGGAGRGRGKGKDHDDRIEILLFVLVSCSVRLYREGGRGTDHTFFTAICMYQCV